MAKDSNTNKSRKPRSTTTAAPAVPVDSATPLPVAPAKPAAKPAAASTKAKASAAKAASPAPAPAPVAAATAAPASKKKASSAKGAASATPAPAPLPEPVAPPVVAAAPKKSSATSGSRAKSSGKSSKSAASAAPAPEVTTAAAVPVAEPIQAPAPQPAPADPLAEAVDALATEIEAVGQSRLGIVDDSLNIAGPTLAMELEPEPAQIPPVEEVTSGDEEMLPAPLEGESFDVEEEQTAQEPPTPSGPTVETALSDKAEDALADIAAAIEATPVPLPGTVATVPGSRRILFVTAECAPYAKTGGLADAVAGLAKTLKRSGHDVRIILPLYALVDRARYGLQPASACCVHMGNHEENWVGIQEALLDGLVPVWFVDHYRFFGRPGLYNDAFSDYADNAYRFGLLCKAAMQYCKDVSWIPDIMHLHDWHAAPTAAFLKTWDNVLSPLSGTASVLTIHNIGHQGKYHPGVLNYYGVGWEHFTSDKFEDNGGLNLLKAGIHFADAITTVSPTHARELLEPIGGQGLAEYIRRRSHDFSGILNGTDLEHWNPATDKLIPATFTPEDLAGKAICKAELQRRFGLQVNPNLPVFGIVSRFAEQKGFDLLRAALPRALGDMEFQLAVLGSGDPNIEMFFRWLSSAFPGRAGDYIGYNNDVAHLIEAGSDFFLMPSLYEPCGLNQIYSLAYATLPIVRATGGLEDTVENYTEWNGGGTGFKFNLPTPNALYDTIGWATSTWYDRPHHIASLRRNAMSKHFTWDDSVGQYEDVFEKAIANRRR
ncbi:MAG: glycogen synthase [Candidatus Methylacidiphilales bacterium]